MEKIVLSSLLGCCCYFCISIGSTGHAEDLATTRPLLVASSKSAKSITIDGVEYVPKEKERKRVTSVEKEDETSKSPFSKFFEGSKNGKLKDFEMKGKYGAGLEVSVVNLGIGPSAEYWLTDNIVASVHLGLGSFTTYGIRGDYVFSKPVTLSHSYITEPYVGLGYTSIKGPEESFPGGSVKTDGSGVDLHAGLFMPAQYIYKNVALRAEVAYSMATVEATAKVGTSEVTVSADYSSFGLGLGIYYFFK